MEKSKEGDGYLPWMRCVMGCRPPEDKVILLKCFEVICSQTCKDNWKMDLNLSKESLHYCPLCQIQKEEDLEEVSLKKVFPSKPSKDDVKLNCEWCIHDKPAITFCPVCSLYLCEDCTNSHSQLQRLTLNHMLEKNLDQRREMECQRMREKQNQCIVEDHASPLTKCCTTCQQKLCVKCNTDHDASHNILETQQLEELLNSKLDELFKKFEESIAQTRCKRKEFDGSKKYVAISSKIDKDFGLMHQTLRECQEQINAEVRNALNLRKSAIFELEKKMGFMKNKIAQIRKTYASVQENLDKAANDNFSLRALETVKVLAKILKNSHEDMVENSKEFSLDPEFMKSVHSLLEQGLAKLKYELDLNNLDETASATLLDGSTQAQGVGRGTTSEKDIIVTSVFSLNPFASSAPKVQGIAQKNTGYGDVHHLRMPHLEKRPSLNQGQITPKPANKLSSEPFFMNGEPGPTDPAPNRNPATSPPATTPATYLPLPSTCSVTITPIHSATSTHVEAMTPISKSPSSDALSAESFQTAAFQMYKAGKQNLKNVTSQPVSSITVTASEGKVIIENGRHASTEKVSEGTSKETADQIVAGSPLKTTSVEGRNEAKDNGGKDNSTVTVQSPGTSPNGTSLSGSCDDVATVRKGLRNRKKRIYQDCVDPTKDIKLSEEEDMLKDKILALSAPSSRRQSLRKQGHSSASKHSNSALVKLASDKKKGNEGRTGKIKRTCKRVSNDFLRNESSTDKSGEKKFKCKICSKTLKSKCILVQHEKIHTGERPFQCRICKKSFLYKFFLTRHTWIHTGEKPYSCRTCGERFRYSQYLKAHKSKLNH